VTSGTSSSDDDDDDDDDDDNYDDNPDDNNSGILCSSLYHCAALCTLTVVYPAVHTALLPSAH